MFIANLNSNKKSAIDELFEMMDSVDNNFSRIYPNSYRQHESSDYKTDTDDDGVILTMNVPGYNKKLIDIHISGNKLKIEGKAHSGDVGGFIHNFTINDNLDADESEATVIDGVLTVSIPYAEKVKPRKVEVKAK